MRYDEFPHEVSVQVEGRVSDGSGGHTSGWTELFQMEAFVDTPSSREQYEAMKLNNPLDRYMYYPYRTDVVPNMRVLFDGDTYEIAGMPEDQGGQHEIMRVALKRHG